MVFFIQRAKKIKRNSISPVEKQTIHIMDEIQVLQKVISNHLSFKFLI